MKQIIIVFFVLTAAAVNAQVLKQKAIVNSSNVAIQNKSAVSTPIAKPAQPANMPAASGVNVAVKQPVNQMPVRGTQSQQGTRKNIGQKALTPLSPSLTGIYPQQMRSNDGKAMTINYRLSQSKFATPITGALPERKVSQATKNYSNTPDGDWNCSEENIRVKITDDSYMKVPTSAQAANIFPGAIYEFNNYVNGTWKREDNDRLPIVLSASVENMSGSPNERIEAPDRNSIRAGIVNLFSKFSRQPAEIANGAFKVRVEEVWSASDLDIKIGATGYGGGFSASNSFSFQKKTNNRCFLFDCTKEMFTIDVSKPAGGFFAVMPQVQSPLMYISSVTYGLRVIALVQIEISDETIANNFNGSYTALTAGGSVAIDVASKINNQKTTVAMYVVGGQSSTVYQEYSIDAMKARLQQISATLNYNTSKPISYVFRNMDDEVVHYSSATDWFPMRNCEPKAEADKAASFAVSISRIALDNWQEDDVDLYGTIRAEIIDGNGAVVYNGLLADIPAAQYIKRSSLNSIGYSNRFNKANAAVAAGAAKGAVLKITYWLRDHDDFGDDDIVMSGRSRPDFINPGNCRHYVQTIGLDEIKRGTIADYAAGFTDDEGDYPFTISIQVEKK